MPNGLQSLLKEEETISLQFPNPFTVTPFEQEDFNIYDREEDPFQIKNAEELVSNMNLENPQNMAEGFYNAASTSGQYSDEELQKILTVAAGGNLLSGGSNIGNFNAQKTWLLDNFGIDIDKYKEYSQKRASGGLPFIAAGNALIEASRAGYNVPQALTKMFAAFGATKDKLNQIDPSLLGIAKMFMDWETSAANVGSIEGEFEMMAPTIKDGKLTHKYVGTQFLTDASIINGQRIGWQFKKIEEGENATKRYLFYDDKNNWVTRNLTDAAYERAEAENPNRWITYDQVAERQTVPVYDTVEQGFSTKSLAEYNRLTKSSLFTGNKEDEGRYQIEDGAYVNAEFIGEANKFYKYGDQMQAPKSWLARPENRENWLATSDLPLFDLSYNTTTGLPEISMTPSTIAGGMKLDQVKVAKAKDSLIDFTRNRSSSLSQMSVTVDQIFDGLVELGGKAGGPARAVDRFLNTVVGGAREIIGGSLSTVPWTDFNFIPLPYEGSPNTGKDELNFNDIKDTWQKEYETLVAGGSFGFLDEFGDERGPAAVALGNALFSLAMQNAMNSYGQTARAISDRDLVLFLRAVGEGAGTTQGLVRSLVNELERGTLVKFDKDVESTIYYQPVLDTLEGKIRPFVEDDLIVLKEGIDPDNEDAVNNRANYILNPTSPVMQSRNQLRASLDKLNAAFGKGRKVDISETLGTASKFMENLNTATNKDTYTFTSGLTFDFTPSMLQQKIDTRAINVPPNSLATGQLTNIKARIGDQGKLSMRGFLEYYNSALWPTVQPLFNSGIPEKVAQATEMHNDFLATFFKNDTDRERFDNLLLYVRNRR
jgi:hypothetical protein